MQHRRATGGLDWMDWISPGGVKYRAPYGAKNEEKSFEKK